MGAAGAAREDVVALEVLLEDLGHCFSLIICFSHSLASAALITRS